MATKPAAKSESLTDKLNKLLEQGDPLLAAAMLLGGTAAATGITPPLMRLLSVGGTNNNDFESMATIAAAYAGGLIPGLLYTGYKLGGGNGSETEDAKGAKYYTACFCEGAVEVFLMSKLFSNPEFMKGLMGAASSGVGLLKGVAAAAL